MLAEQIGLEKMPQDAATAWGAVMPLFGAAYKPLVYVGKQVTRGNLYWFIAEETMSDENFDRRIVIFAINEFGDMYSVVPSTFDVIVS